MPWRLIGWGGAAALLAVPAVATRFTREVNWDEADFIFAAVLFGLVGLGIELAVRASTSRAWRAGAGLAVFSCFALVWVNAAVGMIGDEDNAYNLWFLGLIPVAIAGAVVARLRAGRMAVAMLAVGAAQVLIAVGGFSADRHGAVLSMVMASSWLLSAAFFLFSARRGKSVR
ncbi:MAG TPA: hypothetical protein VEZ20_00790 [Allosphingosinicella sp.]|nr:hypothetical protein [Allosphingosinicella sp.]